MGDEKIFQVLKILKVRSRKRDLSFEKVFREFRIFKKRLLKKKTSRILNLNNFESSEISKKDISKILKISIISKSQKKNQNFERFEILKKNEF